MCGYNQIKVESTIYIDKQKKKINPAQQNQFQGQGQCQQIPNQGQHCIHQNHQPAQQHQCNSCQAMQKQRMQCFQENQQKQCQYRP